MIYTFLSKRIIILCLLLILIFISVFTFNGSKKINNLSNKEHPTHNSNTPKEVTYKSSGVIKIAPTLINNDVTYQEKN